MKKTIVSVLCSIVLLFSGCASTGTSGQMPEQGKIAARIAVTYATMKVIEKKPGYAGQIVAIAGLVRQVTSGDKVTTVALLDTFIRSQIDFSKLSPADAMVVSILLDEVKIQLEAKVGTGQFNSANLVVVSEVVGWIETAAKASTPVK